MSAPAGVPKLLWDLKVRVQFTGWLQYAPLAGGAGACLLVAAAAAVGGAVGLLPFGVVWIPLVLGALFLLAFVFDVLVVRTGLHPSEPIPARRDEMDAFDLMRARRSCRSFQARNLTQAHRTELMDSVRRHTHPTALIGDRPIRLEYVAAPLTVWPVIGGHEFLVAIAPRAYDRLAVIDVGRSLQKVVLDATRMGLGTCWIGPGADQKSIVAHLGSRFDPEEDHVICVCAVGYASAYLPLMIRGMQVAQHQRRPLSELFFADPRCSAPLDVRAPPFDRFGRCYEVCQWSPSSFNEQPTRCAATVGERAGSLRFDFLAATTSRFYAPVALGIWCANWETGCAALGIRGHVAALGPEERDVADAPELPRYDLSWVLDPPAPS